MQRVIVDMKKIITILLLAIMALCLTGCGGKSREVSQEEAENRRISCIYSDAVITVYRDNETGVQYLSRYNGGTCVMVKPDGTPYTD